SFCCFLSSLCLLLCQSCCRFFIFLLLYQCVNIILLGGNLVQEGLLYTLLLRNLSFIIFYLSMGTLYQRRNFILLVQAFLFQIFSFFLFFLYAGFFILNLF